MKKEVYFVQTGCVCNNEYYLPYAVGIIASYAFADERINSNYSLEKLFYKCDDVTEIVDEIKNPGIVAFSCYMWNYSFNLKLASVLKEKFPDSIVIFGGHHINENDGILEQYPFIDYLIYGEGEDTFLKLLLCFAGYGCIDDICNISFRHCGKIINTPHVSLKKDINEFPSPYLSGIFDDILKNNDDKFAAVIETNRGCPYHCSYCDWGDYNNTVRRFDFERVCREIEWLGKHAISYFVIADSNFGFFPEDEKIIDKIIETKKIYGYPKGLTVAFKKNSTEQVFRMNKKLYNNSLSRGATLSMQTLSPAALKRINRENMPAENFVELMKLYNENNIPSYTELILGLPGETYDSFCDGINFLLENGQHNSIHVFLCELLPNSTMCSKEYIEKYKIQSVKRKFVMRAGNKSIGMDGWSTIVNGTYSMSKQDMYESLVFSFAVQVFHNYGLLRFIAIYLHEIKKVSYRTFYEELIKWFRNNPNLEIAKIFAGFNEIHKKCLNGEVSDTYYNSKFGNTQFNLTDGAFLEFNFISDVFYEEISEYLLHFFIHDDIIDELLNFQKAVINSPYESVKKCILNYNWIDYFYNIIATKKTSLKRVGQYELSLYSPYTRGVAEYVENVIIKGRRTGESIIINNPDRYHIRSVHE